MDKWAVLDLLCNVLGDYSNNHSQSDPNRYAFNCPECGIINGGEPDDKFNLEVNLQKGVYHCWKCGDLQGTKGRLGKLMWKYGTKTQKREYDTLTENFLPVYRRKDFFFSDIEEKSKFDFTDHSNPYLKYLINERKLDQRLIEKYNIQYIDEGYFKGFVYIPSHDQYGETNAYVLRSINPNATRKYIQKIRSSNTVFFEDKIKWDCRVYLTEGVFDAIVTPNGLPLLGKHAHDNKLLKIGQRLKSDVVLILDKDTDFESDYLPLLKRLKIFTNNKVHWIKPENMDDLSAIFAYGGYGAVGKFIQKQINEFNGF